MTISIHATREEFAAHVRYVAGFLDAHPFKPPSAHIFFRESTAQVRISYGSEPSHDHPHIPRQHLLFSTGAIDAQRLVANAFTLGNDVVYSVEAQQRAETDFYSNGVFAFDIIETIFFHISRYEEHQCTREEKDEWGMMHENHQFLVRCGLQRRPVVDELVRCFFKALGLEVQTRPTTYALSHDIDVLRKWPSPYRFGRTLMRMLLDGRWRHLPNIIGQYIRVLIGARKDPYNTFDQLLIDGPGGFGEKIAFMMAGGETKHDNYYRIDGQQSRKVIAKLRQYGYHIGLHASYNAGEKVTLFASEKKRLGQTIGETVIANRQHFLRFSFGQTGRILEGTDIHWDSTLGYQRLIGFRCGTAFPYALFCFDDERAFRFQERPMIVMDGALLDENDGDIERAQADLFTFLDTHQNDTHIHFNVHNTIFDETKRDVRAMVTLYEAVCQYVRQKGIEAGPKA